MTLFSHAQEFKALYEILENDIEFNEETGEVINNDDVIDALFNDLKLGLGDKMNDSQRYIIDVESRATALKDEAKRLAERAKVMQNRATRVKELMKAALISTGQTKLKTDLFNFSIRSSESVDILDVDNLPREYVRLTRAADKKAIKDALKKGEEIDGCSIVVNKSLGAR